MIERDTPQVIPYPDMLVARLWRNSVGWWCTIRGREGYDAPYWHSTTAARSPMLAMQQAYEASLCGFEGEGIQVEPATDTLSH